MLTDERYKQLMEQVGLPNSRSLLQALKQAVMEATLNERNQHISQNTNTMDITRIDYIKVYPSVYDNTMKCPYCDFTYEDHADSSYDENVLASKHLCTGNIVRDIVLKTYLTIETDPLPDYSCKIDIILNCGSVFLNCNLGIFTDIHDKQTKEVYFNTTFIGESIPIDAIKYWKLTSKKHS